MADEQSRNNGEKTGKPMPPVEHRFKPGNPGRPKGARNKLGEAFIEALNDDFAEHGVAAIQAVRKDKPDQYLKVIASLCPKELTVNFNDAEELTDDELRSRIRALAASLAPLLGGTGNAEGRAGEAGGAAESPCVH
jgi:hypothetical protein